MGDWDSGTRGRWRGTVCSAPPAIAPACRSAPKENARPPWTRPVHLTLTEQSNTRNFGGDAPRDVARWQTRPRFETTGLCLLSLDWGDVRGLSSLYILKGPMARLNRQCQSNGLARVKPCDIFDLISWIHVLRPPVSPMTDHSIHTCFFA